MKLYRNVAFCQAKNRWLCIHVGSTALMVGHGWAAYAHRLEVFTPCEWFRFSWGQRK